MFVYPFISKKTHKNVIFGDKSKYILKDGDNISEDQYDLNKLFGFTSSMFGKFSKQLPNTPKEDLPFFYRPAHWNSARFTWYYDPTLDSMYVTTYVYDMGVRKYDVSKKQKLDFNKEYRLEIVKNDKSYTFNIYDVVYKYAVKTYELKYTEDVVVQKTSIFGWKLPLFFGGNKTAPSTIKISMF